VSVSKELDHITKFRATNYMVQISKQLLKEHDALHTPSSRPSTALSKSTANYVMNFCNGDDIRCYFCVKMHFISIEENMDSVDVSLIEYLL
jgi:hypothetical protein